MEPNTGTLSSLPIGILAPLAALVLCAAFVDAKSRRIPNWLTGAGILIAFAIHIGMAGVAGLWLSALGMMAGFTVYLLLYLLRALGAGDVKLMAAVGAFAGPSIWLEIFVATAMVGAAVALIQAAAKRRLSRTLSNTGFIAQELMHFRAPYLANASLDVKSAGAITLPHGVAIAAGCLLLLAFHA